MTIQQPIRSPFGASSTASDALAGIDLTGRTAVVTGGYSGIGLEITRALHAVGARIVVPARRAQHAKHTLHSLPRVTVMQMDLADIASVRAAAAAITAAGDVDLLIAAAGIMAAPEQRIGPGWESHFAINHLGHHALVSELLPTLRTAAARIILMTSAGHTLSDLRWDDLHFRHGYDRWQAYGQSKTANALSALALASNEEQYGITAYSVHPGAILTPLQRHLTPDEMRKLGWVASEGALPRGFKSPQQGAATAVWAATTPLLAKCPGAYLEDCNVARLAPGGEPAGVRPWATSIESAQRLWGASTDMVAAP